MKYFLCRVILASHSTRMREALLQDQVASKFKKGANSGELLLVDSIEEGLVGQSHAQQQPRCNILTYATGNSFHRGSSCLCTSADALECQRSHTASLYSIVYTCRWTQPGRLSS
jgi:hypothetical protein